MLSKLNFGCGSIQPEGWDNLDVEDFGQSMVGGFELLGDNYYDIVAAHCAVQINGYNELPEMLEELYRILAPGGILRISLPDIERGFKAYLENDIRWFPNGETDIDDRFSHWLTWYSTTKSLLTPQALKNRLCEAGFESYLVNEIAFGESWNRARQESTELDDRRGEVYFMEATK